MTENNQKPCPVCKLEAQDVIREADYGERFTYNCTRCGRFTITRTAESMAESRNLGAKLSAWIRHRFELGMDIPEINSRNLGEIEQSIPNYNPSDKQVLFLRSIAHKSKYPGHSVHLLPDFDYPLAWASGPEEFDYYIRYLVQRRLIARTAEEAFGDMSISVELTADGKKHRGQPLTRDK